MLINNVRNKPQRNINFSSKIVGDYVLKRSENYMKNAITRGSEKDLKMVKDFYENLNKIKHDKSVKVVEFVKYCTEGIDTLADGKITGMIPQQYVKHYGDDYTSVMAIDNYAKLLNYSQQPSELENCNKVYGKYLENHLNKLIKSMLNKDK